MSNTSTSIFLVFLFFISSFSGCIAGDEEIAEKNNSEHWLNNVEDRSNLVYRNDDVFSHVSKNGSHQIDDVRSIFVEVPAITVADGGAGLT